MKRKRETETEMKDGEEEHETGMTESLFRVAAVERVLRARHCPVPETLIAVRAVAGQGVCVLARHVKDLRRRRIEAVEIGRSGERVRAHGRKNQPVVLKARQHDTLQDFIEAVARRSKDGRIVQPILLALTSCTAQSWRGRS